MTVAKTANATMMTVTPDRCRPAYQENDPRPGSQPSHDAQRSSRDFAASTVFGYVATRAYYRVDHAQARAGTGWAPGTPSGEMMELQPMGEKQS